VLALGDSLTYGTGASREESYPAVLAMITGWNVVNAGVPGETAGQGCARMAELLAEHRPQLVLVLLGGNDFLRRLPEQGVRDALARCKSEAMNYDAAIVLVPVPRIGATGLANASLYGEFARAADVPLVDAGLSDLLARPSLRSDPVHLNADGYRALAERVATGLADHGYLSR
jgi:lysophospholipase L1-like esterase